MKKTTFLMLAFLAAFSPIFSQINWFQADDEWQFHLIAGWVGEGREKLWVSGDSILAGQTFKKIDRKSLFSNGAEHEGQRLARQAGRKVFALDSDGGNEFLMYDFDLAVGSKIFIPVFFNPSANFGYEILEVGEIQICGQNRTFQQVKWLNQGVYSSATHGTFIEGMGCVEGRFFEINDWQVASSYLFLDEPDALAVDGERRTFCGFESGNCAYSGKGAPLCAALAAGETDVLTARIWPNPSAGEVFLEMENGAAIEKIEFFDALGRLVEVQNGGQNGSFSTDFKGFGFLKIWTKNGAAIEKVLLF